MSDEVFLSVESFRETLVIRPAYGRLRTRLWTRDECLHWLVNDGYFDCGMVYVDDDGLREEVLRQKAETGR